MCPPFSANGVHLRQLPEGLDKATHQLILKLDKPISGSFMGCFSSLVSCSDGGRTAHARCQRRLQSLGSTQVLRRALQKGRNALRKSTFDLSHHTFLKLASLQFDLNDSWGTTAAPQFVTDTFLMQFLNTYVFNFSFLWCPLLRQKQYFKSAVHSGL